MTQNKNEVKRIVYIEDNGQVKAHKCIIIERGDFWVKLQLVDEETRELVATVMELPVHRILKIKELR